VAVNPATAVRGTGVNLSFHVTNPHPSAALTSVTLTLPTDHPIAEVYPLSVPDWAPRLTSRPLNPPVPGLHGSPLSEATASVTWTAMPGRAIAPGQATDLPVAMGPLPDTGHLQFTVAGSYADGTTAALTVGAGPVTLTLTPAGPQAGAQPGPAAGHPGHGGADAQAAPPAPRQPAQEPVAQQAPAEPADAGWGLLGWLAAALAAAFGIGATMRARRQPAPAPASAERPAATHGEARNSVSDEQPDDAATGRVRVTAWSYRDGP
jgi:hypothetical protein